MREIRPSGSTRAPAPLRSGATLLKRFEIESFPSHFGFLQAEFLHEFVEGGAADAELVGSGRHFAAVTAQSLKNRLPLSAFAGIAE